MFLMVLRFSGNHLHKPASSVDTTMTMSSSERISDMAPTTTSLSAVDSMSQPSAPASQSGMFPPGLSGTPPKEYSQSGVRHTKVCGSGLFSSLLVNAM